MDDLGLFVRGFPQPVYREEAGSPAAMSQRRQGITVFQVSIRLVQQNQRGTVSLHLQFGEKCIRMDRHGGWGLTLGRFDQLRDTARVRQRRGEKAKTHADVIRYRVRGMPDDQMESWRVQARPPLNRKRPCGVDCQHLRPHALRNMLRVDFRNRGARIRIVEKLLKRVIHRPVVLSTAIPAIVCEHGADAH